MKENEINSEQYKRALVENSAHRWALKRGIVNPQAIELLAIGLADVSFLSGGTLQDARGRETDQALNGVFFSNTLLRDNFADQVHAYESSSRTQPQQSSSVAPAHEQKQYREMSTTEKVAYLKAHGEAAFQKLVIDAVKSERQEKEASR